MTEAELHLPHRIFYAPGRDETLADIKDAIPWAGKVDICTIDFLRPFSSLPFPEQSAEFRQLFINNFWSSEDLLIGRSFGAWILLNALMEADCVYPGTVILISSVLGFGGQPGIEFMAPRARSFWSRVDSGEPPPARRIALIHAIDDDQCPFEYAKKLCDIWGVVLFGLEKGGHGLGRSGTKELLAGQMHDYWSSGRCHGQNDA